MNMTREQLESVAAASMSATLALLVEQNIITSQEALYMTREYTPTIIVKESLLQSLATKLFPDNTKIEGKERMLVRLTKV